ncbi:AAA family ATPase [Bradyrhizobium japonicum]|uniref:AAA family ATPase n=1 Tax=Bradyrhizobium japonicum TaxID=375 RepID=UPI001BA6DE5A|nr:AAA family ATPase [Bradyrhizobium japonicum]MBR0809352.1 AAA family ATPase [Bradyrhizobium japonicum]
MPTYQRFTQTDFDRCEIARIRQETGLDAHHAQLMYEYQFKAGRNLYESERTLCKALQRQLANKQAEVLVPLRTNDNGRGSSSFRAPASPQNNTDESVASLDISGWDEAEVPQRDWAVRDRIIRRAVTLLSGEGGVGKSILTLQLACAHVLARDWFGSLPEPGPAIYLDAEDDEAELHFRLEAIRAHLGVTFADLKDGGLHLMPLAGKDALLGVPDRAGVIQPTPLFERLLLLATNIKPVIIVLNSAADLFAGNENNRSEVRQFIGLLRRLGIASGGGVVLTSHPSLSGIASNSGLSGTTGWNNSARGRMFFKAAETEGEVRNRDQRELIVMKSNYGPTGETIRMVWRNGLFVPVSAPSTIERAVAERKVEDLFMGLLARFSHEGRNVSDKTGTNYAPAKFAAEPEAMAVRCSKQALVEAMQRLFTADKIKVREEGPPSHRRSRLVIVGGVS